MNSIGRSRAVPIALAICALALSFPAALLAGDDHKTNQNNSTVPIKRPPDEILKYVPHQLVVRLSNNASLLHDFQLVGVVSIAASLNRSPVYLVNVDSAKNELDIANEMVQSQSVTYAQPNYILSRSHVIQGSYPFPDQNLIGRIGEQYVVGMLGLNSAHQISTGVGVTIGEIDCGVDLTHPGLENKAVSGHDFVDFDDNSTDEPGGRASGHGTFVAGLLHLTAPDATIRAYRVMDQNGYGDGFSLAQAIERASLDGCQIINLSVALTARSLAVRDAIDFAVANGVTVVAGAGNESGDHPLYPAAEPNVIAVAATDSARQASTFSNVGPGIAVCAPGVNTYSTYETPGYAWWSGTSFSAPFVSGLAALLKSHDPNASALKIRSQIKAGAQNIDSVNTLPPGSLGKGIISPVTSLSLTSTPDTVMFIPGFCSVTYQLGSASPVAPSVVGQLISTIDPASYTSFVIDSGTAQFVTVEHPTGLTGDSIRIFVDPGNRSAGTYYNRISFQVPDIGMSAVAFVQLIVLPLNGPGSGAHCSPTDLYYTANINDNHWVHGSTYISSDNAPASFHTDLNVNSPHFVLMIDTNGVTNDSVRFQFVPANFFSAGLHEDTITMRVAGIDNPTYFVVHANITTDTVPTGATAYVTPPGPRYFSMAQGSTTKINCNMVVGSTNAPTWYAAGFWGVCKFTRIIDSSGTTNDTMHCELSAGTLAPGTYVDTIQIYVNAATNSPMRTTIELTITGSGGGGDSASVLPMYRSFSADKGVNQTQHGSFTVGSSGGPRSFTVSHLDNTTFTQLLTTSGTTYDTVHYDVVSTAQMAPGLYADTFLVNVSGVTNSPLIVICNLALDTMDMGGDSATAGLSPSSLSFTAPVGSNDTLPKQVFLSSSHGNVWWVGTVKGGGTSFALLPDTSGGTNDSVDVFARVGGRSVGVYVDTISFWVSGVSTPTKLPVTLTVTSSASPVPLTDLANYPNPFNPTTTIVFSLPVAQEISLDIYNLLGQRVITLASGWMPAGSHSFVWDGADKNGVQVSSGVYLYRLQAAAQSLSRKMLLMK